MPEISAKAVKQLLQLQTVLRAVIAEIEPGSVAVSAEGQEHVNKCVAAGVCLQCGTDLSKEKRASRGLCYRHYSSTMQRINRLAVAEADVIASGYILQEINHGGRKASGPDPVGEMLSPSRRESSAGKKSVTESPDDSGQTSGHEEPETKKTRGKTR
jgi:hypothetical protein